MNTRIFDTNGREIRIGDRVRHWYYGGEGVVIDIEQSGGFFPVTVRWAGDWPDESHHFGDALIVDRRAQ